MEQRAGSSGAEGLAIGATVERLADAHGTAEVNA